MALRTVDRISLTSSFYALRAILQRHRPWLVVKPDKPGDYQAYGSGALRGKRVHFARIRIGKRHVSFQLFPLDVERALTRAITPRLRKRMQGTSCFNFEKTDPAELRDLTKLVRLAATSFKKSGLLTHHIETVEVG